MFFRKQSEIPVQEIAPGFTARFIHAGHLSIGYVHIKAGSQLPEHSHVQEQVTHILEGRLELTIDGVTGVVEPGVVAVIPPMAKHSGRALTDCVALDVFHPIRDDYKRVMEATAASQ